MSKYYLLLISILVNVAIVLSLPSIILAQTPDPNAPTDTIAPSPPPVPAPAAILPSSATPTAPPTSTPTDYLFPAHTPATSPTPTDYLFPAHTPILTPAPTLCTSTTKEVKIASLIDNPSLCPSGTFCYEAVNTVNQGTQYNCYAQLTPTPTSAPPPGGAGQPCKNGDLGIETAIGCVPTEPTQFILAVSKLATGMGGGIALLLMIVGAFKMMTSAGNPDAVKAGSEQITSAVIGLLFIIFAVLLLQVIGVDILALPGFEP